VRKEVSTCRHCCAGEQYDLLAVNHSYRNLPPPQFCHQAASAYHAPTSCTKRENENWYLMNHQAASAARFMALAVARCKSFHLPKFCHRFAYKFCLHEATPRCHLPRCRGRNLNPALRAGRAAPSYKGAVPGMQVIFSCSAG
jgi:hypothetical protein